MIDMNRIRMVMDNVECLTDSFQIGYIDIDMYLIDSLNNVHGPYKEIKAVTSDVALCIGEIQAQIFVDKLGNKTRDEQVYRHMLTNSILEEMEDIENSKELKNLLTEVREEEQAAKAEDGCRITDYEVAYSTNLVQYNLMSLGTHSMLSACISLPGKKSRFKSLFLLKNVLTEEIIKDIFYGTIQSMLDTFIIEDSDSGTLELLDSQLHIVIRTGIDTELKGIISDTVFVAKKPGTYDDTYILKCFNKETLKIGKYSDTFVFKGIEYTVEGQSTKENTAQVSRSDMQLIAKIGVLNLRDNKFEAFRLYKTIICGIHAIVGISDKEKNVALMDISNTEEGLLDEKGLECAMQLLYGGAATSIEYSE